MNVERFYRAAKVYNTLGGRQSIIPHGFTDSGMTGARGQSRRLAPSELSHIKMVHRPGNNLIGGLGAQFFLLSVSL